MLATYEAFATQALTFTIPVGALCAGLLWGFFQRRSHR
jgi:hypothetical protein